MDRRSGLAEDHRRQAGRLRLPAVADSRVQRHAERRRLRSPRHLRPARLHEPTGERRDRGMGRATQTAGHGADQGQRLLRRRRRSAEAVIVVSLTELVLDLGGLGIAALLRSQCEQSTINDGASIISRPTSAYHASHNLYYVKYTIWLRRRNNSLRRTYSVQLASSPTPLFHQLAN